MDLKRFKVEGMLLGRIEIDRTEQHAATTFVHGIKHEQISFESF